MANETIGYGEMTRSTHQSLRCPICRNAMRRVRLERRPSGKVDLDLCGACGHIWFDLLESSQLAPEGVVALHGLIGRSLKPKPRLAHDALRCPRCAERLVRGADVSKNGRFNYYRCPHWHGRLASYASFLLEKGLLRRLNRIEIRALAAQVGAVQCPNCGGSVDIQRQAECAYCGSPIAVLHTKPAGLTARSE